LRRGVLRGRHGKGKEDGGEKYRRGSRVKRARDIVHAAASCIPNFWKNAIPIPGLDQLTTAMGHHPIPDSVSEREDGMYGLLSQHTLYRQIVTAWNGV